ncbi:MAG TPA: rhodanese-like domain-containing protein [Stellaceae bacterium]|jgi:rhodanese-related sulfurtransferase|nr:rhodanese-like domain-containing protein [Stellaceae bacterium]
MNGKSESIDTATLRRWLADGGEIALIDVREEGQPGAGHPLLAVNLAYSRLELDIGRLVPRRSCRVVLVDDGDGVAERAARRLSGLGYTALHVLDGGVPAWDAAGHPLFPSSNVPSKAFAEIVEHELGTPAIAAAELDRRRRAGENIVVLDSRPAEEYAQFHVPGAITCPGAELPLRFDDLVTDPETTVVVSCAGRTRGIIGAQALITAGVPNPVMSLQGGTQGWRLAGLDLEHGPTTTLRPLSPDAAAAATTRAEAIAARYGIRSIDHPTLAGWQAEAANRTTYLLDVRNPDEFAAGHLRGSLSAPGGQLVQAIDRWVGIRGARLVLVDDRRIRAVITTYWLTQMGWDAVVLDAPFDGQALETGRGSRHPALPEVLEITIPEAAHWLDGGAASVVIGPSAEYKKAHPEGAVWAIRPRLDRLPAGVLQASRIVLFADDAAVGALAAAELAEIIKRPVALLRDGIAGWRAAGRPFEASPDDPPDSERIDYVFWNHDRHDGNQEAMRAYLRWETELPAEIARDGQAGFRLHPH